MKKVLGSLPAALCLGLSVFQSATAAGLLEVYQDALASDPDLQQAASTRLAEREAKPQAKATWLPQINAGVNLTQEFDVDPPNFGDSSFDSRSINLQLNQNLYNRANWYQLEQADALLDLADANYNSIANQLVLRVAQAYFNVLSAQDDLTFTLADKNAIARQLDQAKQRFEVGLITITDVQEAQARFDSIGAAEIVTRNTLDDRKEQLRQFTGKHYESYQGLSQRMPMELPNPDDPKAWVEQAIANNPQLASAESGVDIAQDGVEIARSGHYPTVGLVAGYSDAERNSINSNGGRIGIEVAIPLFQGYATQSRTREAAYRLEAAKQARESQLRAIETQVHNAYRGVAASITQIKALKQAMVSSASALEATEAGFEVGTRTIVDVLNTQRDLFQAERNYAIARYGYLLNLLSLKQAAGVIDLADVEEIQGWLDPAKK